MNTKSSIENFADLVNSNISEPLTAARFSPEDFAIVSVKNSRRKLKNTVAILRGRGRCTGEIKVYYDRMKLPWINDMLVIEYGIGEKVAKEFVADKLGIMKNEVHIYLNFSSKTGSGTIVAKKRSLIYAPGEIYFSFRQAITQNKEK